MERSEGLASSGSASPATGSFSDDGAGPYSVLVDYGDGTTPESLSLDSDGSIPLTHTYARAGTYVVTVGVTDLTGGVGLQLTTINVGPAPLPVSGLGAGRDAYAITLYGALLGRVPTRAELTRLDQRLKGPASYARAAVTLSRSVEYRQLQRSHQGTGTSVRAAYHAAITARNHAEAATATAKHLAAKAARSHKVAHR